MHLKVTLIVIGIISTLIFAPVTLAINVTGQAGDIAAGVGYQVTKNDIASYFYMGTEGRVSFYCELTGKNVKALLYGGKNLAVNAPVVLAPGFNGYYTWKLRNLGEKNGNIKVRMLEGDTAYVRCQSVQ